jgi:flavin-dependent dehydrogenase
MPRRATKRGAERTPLSLDADVLICGASFAGLAVARELAGSGAKVVVIDRYEIGERQTSACAAPTQWLQNLGLEESVKQTFDELVIHRPGRTFKWQLPWTFSTFDYPLLCSLLADQGDFEFETAKVDGRTEDVVHTDRGDIAADLIVDSLGWRRVLSRREPGIQPPNARLSRGLEVHPHGTGTELELWLDKKYVRPGYSWSFPAGDEVRVGVGSFNPRIGVKAPTVQLAGDLGIDLDGYQGNWIPHRLRDGTEDGVFFCGDSAGHCLPTTAEGIRTALYFGLAVGRELRMVVEGRQPREQALARYHEFNDSHRHWFDFLWHVQTVASATMGMELMDTVLRGVSRDSMVNRFFNAYLRLAPPEFALADARRGVRGLAAV